MGYRPGGRKESDTTERLHFHFLHCLVLGKIWWLRWQKYLLAMQDSRVPSLGQGDPLEKGITTHSSILA